MRIASIIAAVIAGVFLCAFGLAWNGFVGFIDYLCGKQIVLQMAAEKYPTAPGVISTSTLTYYQGGKHSSYRWQLAYRYNAGGEDWTGGRYRYNTSNTGTYTSANANDAGWLRQLVAEHPPGSTVPVYYNPQNPQEAVLAPGVTGEDLVLLLFLTPFNMVALGFWLAAYHWGQRQFWTKEAGGVHIIRDGFRQRVRLPVFTPALVALITTGALGFVCAMGLGVGYQFRPPLEVVEALIALAYGAGVVAFLVQWWKVSSGKDDLVIDEGSRTLELPMTYGRKQEVPVAFGEILSIRVETLVHQGKNGPSYTYAPTLFRRNGPPEGDRLADWGSSARAQAFAEWLRKQTQLSN